MLLWPRQVLPSIYTYAARLGSDNGENGDRGLVQVLVKARRQVHVDRSARPQSLVGT